MQPFSCLVFTPKPIYKYTVYYRIAQQPTTENSLLFFFFVALALVVSLDLNYSAPVLLRLRESLIANYLSPSKGIAILFIYYFRERKRKGKRRKYAHLFFFLITKWPCQNFFVDTLQSNEAELYVVGYMFPTNSGCRYVSLRKKRRDFRKKNLLTILKPTAPI